MCAVSSVWGVLLIFALGYILGTVAALIGRR